MEALVLALVVLVARRRLSLARGKARQEKQRKRSTARSWGRFGRRDELMPRPLQRVRLESGLKLNLNRLARQRLIRPGACTGPIGIGWIDSDGEQIASGLITAE